MKEIMKNVIKDFHGPSVFIGTFIGTYLLSLDSIFADLLGAFMLIISLIMLAILNYKASRYDELFAKIYK